MIKLACTGQNQAKYHISHFCELKKKNFKEPKILKGIKVVMTYYKTKKN